MPKVTQLQLIDLNAKDGIYQIRLDQFLAFLTRQYDLETYGYQFAHARHRLANMMPYGRLPTHLTHQFSSHVSHSAPFKTSLKGQEYNLLYWITKAVDLLEEKKHGDLACALETLSSQELQAMEKAKKRVEMLAQAYINQVQDEQPLHERLYWLKAAIGKENLKIDQLNKNLTPENISAREKMISMCNSWRMELEFGTAALNEKIKKCPAIWMVGPKLIHDFNLMQARCILLTNLPATVLAEVGKFYPQFLRKNSVMVGQEKEASSDVLAIMPAPALQKDSTIPFVVNPHRIFSLSPRMSALVHKFEEQKDNELLSIGPD